MSKKTELNTTNDQIVFSKKITAIAKRKINAKHNATQGVWFGLGMMGLIGWSVVIPTLLGASFGVWLDSHHPAGSYSWTLMMMALGLAIGCLNAWHWVVKEEQEIHKGEEDNNV